MQTEISNFIKFRIAKLEKFALLICGLAILGMFVGWFSNQFRYSDLRIIYQIGSILCYVLWGISFGWGLINAIIFLLKDIINGR